MCAINTFFKCLPESPVVEAGHLRRQSRQKALLESLLRLSLVVASLSLPSILIGHGRIAVAGTPAGRVPSPSRQSCTHWIGAVYHCSGAGIKQSLFQKSFHIPGKCDTARGDSSQCVADTNRNRGEFVARVLNSAHFGGRFFCNGNPVHLFKPLHGFAQAKRCTPDFRPKRLEGLFYFRRRCQMAVWKEHI